MYSNDHQRPRVFENIAKCPQSRQSLSKIHEICIVWFIFTSTHSLFRVTLCKIVAIITPLRYEQILSRRRCFFIIAGIWLSGAVTAIAQSPRMAYSNLITCVHNMRTTSKLPSYIAALLISCVAIGNVPACYCDMLRHCKNILPHRPKSTSSLSANCFDRRARVALVETCRLHVRPVSS